MTVETRPPTTGETRRLTSALIQRAARWFVDHNDPLGFGDVGDFGPVRVGRDFATGERLQGLHLKGIDLTGLETLVTPEDVVRNVFGVEVENFPADRIPDVQREIEAAADWIRTDLERSYGVA